MTLLHHMLAVSRATAFAHEHGIVHRDIKPEKIMVRPSVDVATWPAELAVIVGRALAPDPESRYSDARSLAADLEACLARKPATETAGPSSTPLPIADTVYRRRPMTR